MHCPVCNSEDLRRFAVLHQTGMSVIDTRSLGAGFAGGIGVGGARTRGTQTSMMSIRTAPPVKQHYGKWVVGACIFAFIAFVAHAYGWLILTAVFGAVAYQRSNWNSLTFPGLMAQWNASFMCQRCGWAGIVELPGPKPVTDAAALPAAAHAAIDATPPPAIAE
jgi:hypothetical protein